MALVPSGASGALVVSQAALRPVISEEEQQKRIEDANKLEEKLNYIQNEVATRIYNVSGSTAGAGSGDFHQYRTARRREQFRVARIEEAAKEEEEQEAFEKQRDKRVADCEERTNKRRAKRQKKKDKKKSAKGTGAQGEAAPASKGGDDSDPEQAELD